MISNWYSGYSYFIYLYSKRISDFLLVQEIFIDKSSSSLCRAASTDIPDPLSPLLPIIHRLWQVFRATSRIIT